jgi:hypothetical protein
MKDILKLIGLSACILGFVIIGPLLSIWAWNVLFGALYHIPYTLDTWAAVGILFSAVKYKG